jgi:hypothetical protein
MPQSSRRVSRGYLEHFRPLAHAGIAILDAAFAGRKRPTSQRPAGLLALAGGGCRIFDLQIMEGMMSTENQFANGRFPRTEPREWQHIPFADGRKPRLTLKHVAIALMWAGLFALSIWSINDSISNQSVTQARVK